jgi:plasmid maintenance system antidote protein VapI
METIDTDIVPETIDTDMSLKKKTLRPLSDALKAAIAESGQSFRSIGTATGVEHASINRFVRGERSLRLDVADKLAAYFKLKVTRGGEGK